MRTLVYVHGHPSLQAGGSEVAAYALFCDLKACGQEQVVLGVAESSFIGGRPALAPGGRGRVRRPPRATRHRWLAITP